MSNKWKIEQFSASQIKLMKDNETLEVPLFQRGVVWSDKQKNYLVDTIKKGLPFGTLLLQKDGNKYKIIDGLQRSTAIIEFVENPARFFNEDDIDNDAIKEIVKLINENSNQNVTEEMIAVTLVNWVKDMHQTLDQVEEMQYAKFAKYLSKDYPICKEKSEEIGDFIEPMMKKFRGVCKDINNVEIPAIVLELDEDNLGLLPILFERINSKGTHLSKYDIYAASWESSQNYIIDDQFKDIVCANRDRYDSMLNDTFQLDDYDSASFVSEKRLNPFQLAFGLGKYMCKKWPHLFGKGGEEKDVNSVGFSLINSCLGLKNSEIVKMDKELNKRIGYDKINLFLNKIDETITFVDGVIGKFNKFKSNSSSDAGKTPLHSEFQILSIVVSVFLLKYTQIEKDESDKIVSINYNFDKENKDWSEYYKAEFTKNAPKKYIMDTLENRWSGSGDKKLDAILNNPDFYTKQIDKDDFRICIERWNQTNNSQKDEHSKVSSPKAPELLFIATVYLSSFTAQQQTDGSQYDIEHLATKKLMKKSLDRYGSDKKLPIGSIGNICLLPSNVNRGKKDKTIYQDTECLNRAGLSMNNVEKMYTFTKQSDLAWLDDESLKWDEFKEKYEDFIETRFNRMKEMLLNKYDSI